MKLKLTFAILLGLFVFLISMRPVFAQTNNKFGIHIIDENDLEDAADLVNSNGGEWGYVTLVIREDQRNNERWQSIFDSMRELKLIPIVRIATKFENNAWQVPQDSEANNWSAFLNGLNWPVKNRYVALFNEPNHAKEWGGKVDPNGFAKSVLVYENALRNASDEFVVMIGALDLAAPNSANTMEASRFFERMHDQDQFIFTRFDAWNSHSYPNPGFSGSVNDQGKMSIQGYKWELDYLQNFGLNPEIPVFITETGWVRDENEEEIAENYIQAFESVWSDPQIMAVTPFLLNYIGEPFQSFAWKNSDSGEFYPQYNSVQDMKKAKGSPKQNHSYKLVRKPIAERLVAKSEYIFTISLKNTGQSIWSDKDGFSIHFDSNLGSENIFIGRIGKVKPGQDSIIPIKIETDRVGVHNLTLQLNKNGEQIGELIDSKFEIIPPPSLEIHALSWFGFSKSNEEFKLTISKSGKEILNLENLTFDDGVAIIPRVYSVVPGTSYDIVLEREYHLTKLRQTLIGETKTVVDFGRLLPLDLNNDGEFSAKDILEHIKNPFKSSLLLSPFK